MTGINVTKEFHKLTKSIGHLSDHQAVISSWDDEDVSRFKLKISPHGGPYNGGSFIFTVKLSEEFPSYPPEVRCETPIYHPNIDPTEESSETNVCVSMFDHEEWQESYGVDGIIQGLLFLFYQPNLEDPLSPYFDSSSSHDDFEENVLASLKGKTVEQVSYSWNYFGEAPSSHEKKKKEGEEDVTVDVNINDNGKEGDDKTVNDNGKEGDDKTVNDNGKEDDKAVNINDNGKERDDKTVNDNGKEGNDDKGDKQSDTSVVEGHNIHNVQPLDTGTSVDVVVRKVEGSLDTVEDIPRDRDHICDLGSTGLQEFNLGSRSIFKYCDAGTRILLLMHDRRDFLEEHNQFITTGVRQPRRRSMYLRMAWMLLKSALDPFSH